MPATRPITIIGGGLGGLALGAALARAGVAVSYTHLDVYKRQAIIKARGLSSAASAANAAMDSVRSLSTPTPAGDWFSVGVCSDGSYGIPKGIIASMPIRSDGQKWSVISGVPVNDFSRAKIDASVAELQEEISLVSELIPK